MESSMTTDFEDLPDIIERIDRTWKSLNTEEIRLLLLEARSEIRTLRRQVEIQIKLRDEAGEEVNHLQELLEKRR